MVIHLKKLFSITSSFYSESVTTCMSILKLKMQTRFTWDSDKIFYPTRLESCWIEDFTETHTTFNDEHVIKVPILSTINNSLFIVLSNSRILHSNTTSRNTVQFILTPWRKDAQRTKSTRKDPSQQAKQQWWTLTLHVSSYLSLLQQLQLNFHLDIFDKMVKLMVVLTVVLMGG